MELFIDEKTDLTPTGVHSFCTEASSLRIPPGSWPVSIKTSLGNKQPFILKEKPNEAGAAYFQWNGCLSLSILND